MTKEKNLISLKQASKLTGYAPDYIGQLIRAGKIPGQQVNANIVWMTSAEAVLAYKNKSKINKKKTIKEKWQQKQRQLLLELRIIKLFCKDFKNALPILIIILASIFALSIFIAYHLINNNIKASHNNFKQQAERDLQY